MGDKIKCSNAPGVLHRRHMQLDVHLGAHICGHLEAKGSLHEGWEKS